MRRPGKLTNVIGEMKKALLHCCLNIHASLYKCTPSCKYIYICMYVRVLCMHVYLCMFICVQSYYNVPLCEHILYALTCASAIRQRSRANAIFNSVCLWVCVGVGADVAMARWSVMRIIGRPIEMLHRSCSCR